MFRYNRIMAAALLLAALAGLLGCAEQTAESDFLPEAQNDKQLAILPEDWQFMENWQTSDNVPSLLVIQGETSFAPMQFGSSWGYYTDEKQEEICNFVACGMHPLEGVEYMPRLDKETVGEQWLSLVWQAQPTNVGITAYAYDEWQQRKCGNTLPEEITHAAVWFEEGWNFELLADEHNYVYVIDAEWLAEDTPGLGGSSQWAFYVE